MEVFDAIMSRRSVRRYKPELPSREALEKIAEAGLYAASGKGLQTVKIVIITNRELIEKLRVWNREIGGWPESVDRELTLRGGKDLSSVRVHTENMNIRRRVFKVGLFNTDKLRHNDASDS